MGTRYRWVIVAVGALVTCVAIGAMFSLAVFLGPMSASTGWGRATISTAMTLDFLIMGIAGFAWGAASDRFGARIVVLCGAVLLGVGLLIASRRDLAARVSARASGCWLAIAAGAFFAPLTAAVTAWFDTATRVGRIARVSGRWRRAADVVPPFAAWLIEHYDWRTAMAVIGVGAVGAADSGGRCCLAALRAASAGCAGRMRPGGRADAGVAPVPSTRRCRLLRAALVSPQFLVLGVTLLLLLRGPFGTDFSTS